MRGRRFGREIGLEVGVGVVFAAFVVRLRDQHVKRRDDEKVKSVPMVIPPTSTRPIEFRAFAPRR